MIEFEITMATKNVPLSVESIIDTLQPIQPGADVVKRPEKGELDRLTKILTDFGS